MNYTPGKIRTIYHIIITIIFLLLTPIFSTMILVNTYAADLVEIAPVTNTILRLTFDEGYMENRDSEEAIAHRWPLDINIAGRTIYYQVKSKADTNYMIAQMPMKVGRKSKIHDISRNCKWNESLQKCLNEYIQYHFIYLQLPYALRDGFHYSLRAPLLSDNVDSCRFKYDIKSVRSPAIHVNQMGYAPESMCKYAYISQWMGDMGPLEIEGEGKRFDIQKLSSDGSILESVYSGVMAKQKDFQTGGPDSDKKEVGKRRSFVKSDVWECDFSNLKSEGEYILSIEGIGCSYPFRIHKDAYFEPFYYTARANYLERAVTDLPERFAGEFARPQWRPSIVYTAFRTMDLKSESGKSQKQEIFDKIDYNFDVSHIHGWYHDAGDWDGYFSHFRVPRTLMTLYEVAPENFQDGELNIPETQHQNGYKNTHIPDILDEAVWLVDYFKDNIGPTGGIFGSRVQPDISSRTGLSNADYHESMGFHFSDCWMPDKKFWSWNDCRTWIVHGEDPRDSYCFANIAAQYAYALQMAMRMTSESYDEIIKDYLNAAISAYIWAENNQRPGDMDKIGGSHNRGSLKTAKTVAAVWLYKMTGEEKYHDVIETALSKHSELNPEIEEDKWAIWGYVTIDEQKTLYSDTYDKELKKRLTELVKKYAERQVTDSIYEYNRSMRMGGSFTLPILNGQATTPWILPAAIAYKVTGNRKYRDACYMTCDYFLGGNQLNYVWLTNVGHEHPKYIMHNDTEDDGRDGNIPGVPPYSPRTHCDWMRYKGDPCEYQGPWDNDFFILDGRIYPDYYDEDGNAQWPVHELWFDQFTAPPGAEYTIHQNIAPATFAYGFLCASDIKSRPNAKPSVRIQTEKNIYKNGEPIDITINSDDHDGWIYSIKLYKNNRFISDVEFDNPVYIWRPEKCGEYKLTAIVSDNMGATRESNIMRVNIE